MAKTRQLSYYKPKMTLKEIVMQLIEHVIEIHPDDRLLVQMLEEMGKWGTFEELNEEN